MSRWPVKQTVKSMLGSLLVVSLFFMTPNVNAQDSVYGGWDNAMSEGKRAYLMNDLPKSERMFEAALKDVEGSGKNEKKLAESLDHLGVVYFDKKDYVTAEKFFRRALDIELKVERNELALAQRYDRLGTLYLATHKFEQADEHLRKALGNWELALWRYDPKIALTLEYLSAANAGMGKLADAESFAKTALNIRENGPADPKPFTLPAIIQSAKISIKKTDLAGAEQTLRAAMKLSPPAWLPRLNMMIGEVYLNLNEPKKAEFYYAKAVSSYRKLVEKNDQTSLDYIARLFAVTERLGKPTEPVLRNYTEQQIKDYQLQPIADKIELERMAISSPLPKDCLAGTWKGKTNAFGYEDLFEMRWDGNKHCFMACAEGGAELPYDVLYFDNSKIRMRCKGMIFEGQCDGRNMAGTIDDGMGGIILTAKNLDAERIAFEKRLAEEKAVAKKESQNTNQPADDSQRIAAEVEKILRQRESAKEPTRPARVPTYTGPVTDKWALIIGISKFAHPEYNLKYAAKDAQDFRDYLIKESNFAPDHVRLIVNEQATREAIMSAFGDQWLPRVTRPGDLVVIYISTHGTPAGKDKGGKNYIVAYDTNKDSLFATGIPMDLLNDRIKTSVKTERALIVMDTCYSGGAAPGARGGELPSNFSAQEIAQGTGHLVISSSEVDQRSWESKNYANGIFTHYLIEGLRQNSGKNDIKRVYSFVKDKVEWEAQCDLGASQTPQIAGEWQGADLVVSVPATNPREMPSQPAPERANK